MHEVWEVVISCGNDASSGVYDTKREAMDAVDDAAAVDGLTARYGNWCSGHLVDRQGMTWFHFEIKLVEQPAEYVVVALDSGDTTVIHSWHRLVWFAHDHNAYVDGEWIRDNLTNTAVYQTAVLIHDETKVGGK